MIYNFFPYLTISEKDYAVRQLSQLFPLKVGNKVEFSATQLMSGQWPVCFVYSMEVSPPEEMPVGDQTRKAWLIAIKRRTCEAPQLSFQRIWLDEETHAVLRYEFRNPGRYSREGGDITSVAVRVSVPPSAQ